MTEILDDWRASLTRAFVDLFAANVCDFWDGARFGGQDYYGVRLEDIAADGSEVNLALTFRSGLRYCCFEFAYHFTFYSERGWRRLREHMDRHGLSRLPLPVLRKVRGTIERGATIAPSPRVPVGISAGSEYQVGPFPPPVERAR